MVLTALAACLALGLSTAAEAKQPKSVTFGKWEVRTSYLQLLGCLDAQIRNGKSFQSSLPRCKKEHRSYVREILRETQREGRWSSLHRSVKPAVEQKSARQAFDFFKQLYGIKK